MLQCVAARSSMLQRVAACCNVYTESQRGSRQHAMDESYLSLPHHPSSFSHTLPSSESLYCSLALSLFISCFLCLTPSPSFSFSLPLSLAFFLSFSHFLFISLSLSRSFLMSVSISPISAYTFVRVCVETDHLAT